MTPEEHEHLCMGDDICGAKHPEYEKISCSERKGHYGCHQFAWREPMPALHSYTEEQIAEAGRFLDEVFGIK